MEEKDSMNNEIRVGVIRWDSYVDSSLYYSYYGAKVLSPSHYHNRVPFYGKIDDNGQVSFPHYTEEVFNKELTYALDAGIDYFVYFYYSSSPEQYDTATLPIFTADSLGNPCHELKLVQRIHRNSSNGQKMNYCFHLSHKLLTDEDIKILCEEMQRENYEKIDGRPLLFVYNITHENTRVSLSRLLDALQTKNLPKPYLINDRNEETDGIVFDAYSAYSMPSSIKPIDNFDEYSQTVLERNRNFFAKGKGVIPHLSMGWNPSPRIENHVPWYTYPITEYPPAPTKEQLLNQARALKDLVCKQEAFKNHYIVFSWNEFEEGAWICPTLSKDNNVDLTNLKMLKEAIEVLKK